MALRRVYLDLTHVGRHVTGLERIAIEQFEKVTFDDAEIVPVRAKGALSMVLKQQFLLPWLALTHPRAHFIFPGFPPSPVFALLARRVLMYVHDTFLITRRADLSRKARLYMAPQFAFALRHLRRFLVNSEKTLREVQALCGARADIALYRPAVSNVFDVHPSEIKRESEAPAGHLPASPGNVPARPLRLVTLGTIEPRKNYKAALAILDTLRARGYEGAHLHIIGRKGWGEDAEAIATHPGVTVHGYLSTSDVAAQLRAADLYLCTSHDEGLGLPLLEAQYAGLGIVAPDAPVFREVLATSGIFITPSDPDDAARRISDVLAQPDWRQRARAAAAANIARWNNAALADLSNAKRLFRADRTTSASGLCGQAQHL